MSGSRIVGVRKIGVLRANALGDFVFILPALQSLKAAYPEAELVLLAREWHAAFLEGRPSPVDRVIALPPIRGLSAPESDPASPAQTPPALLARLRSERFDVLIQMHGGGKRSNPFLKEIGAREIVGLVADGSEPLDRSIRYRYFQNETLRYLEVAALAGARPVDVLPRVGVTDDDLREARDALGGTPPSLVVLHPGATDPRRRWPAANFAALGDALHLRGAAIAVTGDESEGTLVREVVAHMRAPACALAGALSLGGLAGVLKLARVAIGNDTGPLHLARAVETPSVTLYWVGNAINGGPLFQDRYRALLSWTIECPVCEEPQVTRRCEHQVSFVDGISVDAVVAEAEDILGSSYRIQARGHSVANQ